MTASGIIDLVPKTVRKKWADQGFYPNVSLFDAFYAQAQRQPSAPAVHDDKGTIVYSELLWHVKKLAAAFKQMGVVSGDVVAYQLPNSWQCCAIDLAVAALGAISCPLPVGRGRLDLEALIRRAHPRVVVMTESHGEYDYCAWVNTLKMTQLSLRHCIVDALSPQAKNNGENSDASWVCLQSLFEYEPIHEDALPKVDPDSPARFLISSGTESDPKLVAYSHNALLGGRGRFLQNIHNEDIAPIAFYMMPLASAFGSSATAGILCWLGGAIVVQKKFDPLSVIQAIEKYKPNYLLGVPTMFQRLLAEPVLKKVDHSSLKAVISGGALIDEATIRKCKEELAPDFISLYGSADGVNCHHKRGESIERLISTVGQPNANVCEIGILDDEGHLLEPGLEGEIAARGPLTPMQYVNAPDLDKKYRNAQGWVLTGDMGLIDERGYLVLRGRKKDTIIRGGMNISPSQIESVISEYSGVVSAACIPVPDPDLGQKVGLCLSMVNGVSRPDLASLNRFLLSKGVEKHKLPEYLRYYRALPLNPAGKVDKKQLQQTFACLADVPHTTMGQALAVISQQHIRSRFKMKFGKRA